ncbi:ABC transporter ATP-binding protein [Actinoplanes sp. NPDC026619]|uniref:ABC transporter ATP-binding protein n=1 Tax=Actinoplanes sp. NPDC026619 TaxID=3155798 RepID=UPI0034052D8D
MSLLQVKDLQVSYRRAGRPDVLAVAGADLSVAPGEIVGLVGETGCGKSTLARACLGLLRPTGGTVHFDGAPVTPLGRRARPLAQRRLQMIFQDPFASLNSRRRVGAQIGDALRLNPSPTTVGEWLTRVGLPESAAGRYPHEFSGGQRQRIAIARALAAQPSLIVADEPIAALDASAQAQIANLLVDLARSEGVSLLFISHDLAIVRQIADRIAVMYLGRVVETGPTAELWDTPAHPYSSALIGAVPRPDGLHRLPDELPGDVPDPASPPPGCRFHPRCPVAFDRCATEDPPATTWQGHTVRCLLHTEGEPLHAVS